MNWKWNGYHFLSFKPSFPQKGPVHIHASPLSGSNVLDWVSISEPSCNSTFMLFESFYTHDLISSSRTGWASNIIPISKTEYVEWQRSNVTCSRPRWHESSNFDQCWSQSMLNTYYKSTLNNFFWKISNHFRRWGVVFRIELWKRKKKRLANVT